MLRGKTYPLSFSGPTDNETLLESWAGLGGGDSWRVQVRHKWLLRPLGEEAASGRGRPLSLAGS